MQEASFSDIIREGYARGVLNEEIAQWKKFREYRGITSHGYDEHKAQLVYENIPPFLAEAKFLYDKLDQGLQGE